MSRSLHWEPVIREPQQTLPDALMFVLDKRYGDGEPWWNVEVGRADLPYIQGLRDSGVEGAGDLIRLIEQHGDVRLDVHG